MKKIILGLLLLSGCAPKIYVVDRQSVFEQESAGDWPPYENKILSSSIANGPTPFAKVELTEKNARLYKVLNGELVAQPANKVDKK